MSLPSLSSFLVALSAVFFVVDPIGVVPLFLAMTPGQSPERRRATCRRACVVAAGLLGFFALFGQFVFRVLGVTLPAFRVAGGVLLLITALDMIRARSSPTRTSGPETQEGTTKQDIAIVPLALPLLAGPGAIATVMVLVSQAEGAVGVGWVLLAIAITLLVSYWLLRSAGMVQRVLGTSGLAILERVMGLLLAAIAVQFIADGARALWRG